MGCWAITPFDNDDAMDWLVELTAQDGLAPIESAFRSAQEAATSSLEAPEGAQALAAAEVVAAALGQASASATAQPTLVEWLDRVRPTLSPPLIQNAIKAVERVLANKSELKELWEDTEDFDQWKSDVESLLLRLRI